jgi:hypothetical protein
MERGKRGEVRRGPHARTVLSIDDNPLPRPLRGARDQPPVGARRARGNSSPSQRLRDVVPDLSAGAVQGFRGGLTSFGRVGTMRQVIWHEGDQSHGTRPSYSSGHDRNNCLPVPRHQAFSWQVADLCDWTTSGLDSCVIAHCSLGIFPVYGRRHYVVKVCFRWRQFDRQPGH